jgi:hypothetical protein
MIEERARSIALRLRCVVSLAALMLAAQAIAASGVEAHFSTSSYTYKGDCSSRVDPVNFGFYGPYAWWDHAAAQTQGHAGWSNTGGSSQASWSHGTCYWMGTQRASAGTSSSRFHIRFFWAGSDPYAVGDAHHEDFVWYCGHAVDSNGSTGSGFDWGRRELMRKFRDAGHYTTYDWWGNTQNFKQCDGDWAGSDGYTRWVWIDH